MSSLLINIDFIIYFYIAICIALLVFNVGYIILAKEEPHTLKKRTRFWQQEIRTIMERYHETETIPPEHAALLKKRLTNVKWLLCYSNALQEIPQSDAKYQYIQACYDIIQQVGLVYISRPAMERAFFSYVVSLYPPAQNRSRKILELLLSFMDNSTVYCRENILQAIYAIGNPIALEHVFTYMGENALYHNPKLISDGLIKFTGNKLELAHHLWAQQAHWPEWVQIAIIQFASLLDNSFQKEFLAALQSRETSNEVKFVLIRYFQKYPYEKAKEFLISSVMDADHSGNGIAIPACSALAAYHDASTIKALKTALYSRNWYVRKNAATALVDLGIDEMNLEEIRNSNDQYAVEMLEYVLKLKKGDTIS